MSSRIIVTEKNSVAVQISKYLGGYVKSKLGKCNVYKNTKTNTVIIPLAGHFISYFFEKEANNWYKIDGAMLMKYPICELCSSTISDALNLLKEPIKEVILATDDDEEGQKIAHDFMSKIRQYVTVEKVLRLRLTSLSTEGLRLSFGEIEENYNLPLALATEARHKMDLLWGFAMTRTVTLKFWKLKGIRFSKNIYSVGRVQTPLLNIIYQRTQEIRNFKPIQYRALSFKHSGLVFTLKNPVKELISAELSKKISDTLTSGSIKTVSTKKLIVKQPPTLMNTTKLLGCGSRMNRTVKEVSELAQTLYLGGFITYPRTDNVLFTKKTPYMEVFDALNTAGLTGDFKDPKYKGKVLAKADHECIMPTEKIPDMGGLNNTGLASLYKIIVESFLNSLKPATEYLQYKLTVTIHGLEFNSEYSVLKKQGWCAPPKPRAQQVEDSIAVPTNIITETKQTQPPPDRSQEALVVEMENQNIGTKSTRSNLIQLLQTRGYTTSFKPRITQKGRDLINLMIGSAPTAISSQFSNSVKNSLGEIKDQTSMGSVIVDFKDKVTLICNSINKN